MPEVYEQFAEIADRLEKHYTDMQDMEFTIENGKLYMLQTRNGKRTRQAALKIAVDLVDEGMIDEEEAVLSRAEAARFPAPPAVRRSGSEERRSCWQGLGGFPGAACGKGRLYCRRCQRVA